MLPPLVVTPDFLYSPARLTATGPPVASPLSTQLLWTGLILDLPLDSFRRVFPVNPVERTLKWANDNARELLRVRTLLIESDLDFQEAADKLSQLDMEPGRWNELAEIEGLALTLTSNSGLNDAGISARTAAIKGTLPEEIRHLVVAAVADLKPLAIRALNHQAGSIATTILIPAPESERAFFDDYGRPLPASWLNREIAIPTPDHSIRQCTHPTGQADRCREILASFPNPAALIAIGIPDPEVAPTLEQRLAESGFSTYDPAGKAVSKEGIYYLLKLTHQLLSSDHFDAFRLLLRCPGYIAAALRKTSPDARVSVGAVLTQFDELASENLPDRLTDALSAAKRRSLNEPWLAAIITWTQAWTARFHKEDFTPILAEYLSEIFEEKRFLPHDPAAAVFTEVAATIHSLAAEIETARAAFPRHPGAEDRFELLLGALAEARVYPERGADDIDLQGWLELPWEDAPHLIVTGMNDHAVPESIIGHAFLPDSARRALGIQNNDDRFSRDAFLLTIVIETRRTGGQIDLLFGRQSAKGDPLRPSRLLFQCQDSVLADRTLHLFSENEVEHPPLPRSIAWRLKPLALPPDHRIYQRINVTGFKQYLTCPFRYFLKFGLGMEKVEAGKNELDPRDFGNLVHAALEELGNHETLRRSTDESVIREFFFDEIDRCLVNRFGPRLTTPVVIQREAARQRLGHWAVIEAEQRSQGWEILEVETPFGKEEWPFIVDDMPVTGRIDRIERHPQHGLRVFDFKTISPLDNGILKTVDSYHLVKVKRTEDSDAYPAWALSADDKGKAQHWIDLQIPLYQIAMSERFPGEKISAGYVTLGKTEAEVRIDLWEMLDESILSSARQCAKGVIAAIRGSVFWPPNESMPDWDEFRDLLSPTAEESVDPTGLGITANPV